MDGEWDGVERRAKPPTSSLAQWTQIGLVVVGSAMTIYVMQQQQQYRLDSLERAFDKHLKKHEDDLESIKDELYRLRIDVVKMATEANKKVMAVQ